MRATRRFVGKAAFNLDEYSQAEIAYRKAADQDGANPLAWQGLAELHTKTGRIGQTLSIAAGFTEGVVGRFVGSFVGSFALSPHTGSGMASFRVRTLNSHC